MKGNGVKSIKEMLSSAYNGGKNSGFSEFVGSVFFALISLLLTLVNVLKHVQPTMTIATSVLALGFGASALLSRLKKLAAARTLILMMCAAAFSMFALIGGNDGFAILWILLVPVIGSFWVGFKCGLIISTYFQLFLVVLFYSPLSAYVQDYYSKTFMLRFPMLYLASFGAVTFLMWQREDLLKRLRVASYYDALTGMLNRRSCNEMAADIKRRGMNPGFVVFSFDLNRLKYANDKFGHQAGDELLKAAATIIERNFRGADCFRTGGDEFVAYSSNINPQKAIDAMKEDASRWAGEYMQSISISVGYAMSSENPGLNFDELSQLADQKMYKDKSDFYIKSGFDRRSSAPKAEEA